MTTLERLGVRATPGAGNGEGGPDEQEEGGKEQILQNGVMQLINLFLMLVLLLIFLP